MINCCFSPLPDHERPSFNVYIHKGELDRIRQWVLKFPHTETGGDLFGLWKNGNELAIHYVLGPGKGCQRSGTSFRQNMEYFETVGQHIVDKHHLCHVGDWHSHHQLGMPHPSAGDKHSIWSYLPEYGFKRFIAFIARIVHLPCSGAIRHVNIVGLGCFLFELKNSSYEPVLQGEFKTVKYPYESPFREDPNIEWRAKQGQEFYPTCRDVYLETFTESTDKTAWIIDQEEEELLPELKQQLQHKLETALYWSQPEMESTTYRGCSSCCYGNNTQEYRQKPKDLYVVDNAEATPPSRISQQVSKRSIRSGQTDTATPPQREGMSTLERVSKDSTNASRGSQDSQERTTGRGTRPSTNPSSGDGYNS